MVSFEKLAFLKIRKGGNVMDRTLQSMYMIENLLLKEAKKAAENSYSPYSGFSVGAALYCRNGNTFKIYTGCNIENSSFTPTVCAERVAFFKAISEGEKEFIAIAVVGGRDGNFENECTPCGVCRQVMAEFCDKDFRVITTKNIYALDKLIPNFFNFSK